MVLQLITANLVTFPRWTTRTWGWTLTLTIRAYCGAEDWPDRKDAASRLWESLIVKGTVRLGEGRLVSMRWGSEFAAIGLNDHRDGASEMNLTSPTSNVSPATSRGYETGQHIASAVADFHYTRNLNVHDPGLFHYIALVQLIALAGRNQALSKSAESTTITETVLLAVLEHEHARWPFTEENWAGTVEELEILATSTRKLGLNTSSSELGTQLLGRAGRMVSAAVDGGLLQSDLDGENLLFALEQVVKLGLADPWKYLLTILAQSSLRAIKSGSAYSAKSALHLWTAIFRKAKRSCSNELLRWSQRCLDREIDIGGLLLPAVDTGQGASVRMMLEMWRFLETKTSRCDIDLVKPLARSAQFSVLAVPFLFEIIENGRRDPHKFVNLLGKSDYRGANAGQVVGGAGKGSSSTLR